MASLLRSGLSICARRVPTLNVSANTTRYLQRRLASDQASGSGSSDSMVLPALGAVSLSVVIYLVSSLLVEDLEM